MSLNFSDVQALANLVRIELTEDDTSALLAPLNRVFSLIEQIQTVDTESISPLTHPVELMTFCGSFDAIAQKAHSASLLRNDEVTEIVSRDDYQRIAPNAENGHYLVPKVIE